MKTLARVSAGMLLLFAVVATSFAAGILDPKLQQRMQTSTGPFQVIVTFANPAYMDMLNSLGVPVLKLTTLPMAGAVLTASQIQLVLNWEGTESVYFNDVLKYFNYDAGEITGAHYVQSTLGLKGTGKTILVLDSGIDATHPDLPFRSKVIENVKIVSDLGVSGTTLYLEGVINTDNTSGHGTHVAGTVAGTGAASANDERNANYYRGVAPDANLVGVGTGETLLILHALVGFDYAIATRDRFGTNVISNSWGNSTSQYDPNDPISRATYEAYRKGIVVTFASGNDGPADNTMSTYAINPWVIGVAAGDKMKALADFSSRGEAGDPFEHPDLTAPGVDITSTRAPGTPVGALGPVVNANHPEYTLRYHTISGTSMATPFVAGSVALLLQANPNLSPDQVEDILVSTTDPMAGYQSHQTGSGYINVRRAVERAQSTTGNRVQFLEGDMKWASQGYFVTAEQTNTNILYYGKWQTVNNGNASGGSYIIGAAKGGSGSTKPAARISFFGTNIKLEFPTNRNGGTAEIFVDGVSHGTISYYSDAERWCIRKALGNLSNEHHNVELRGLNGKIYLDKILVDGKLVPANATFVEQSMKFNGTMAVSALGTPETQLIPFQVANNTLQITAELGWTGGVDIDMYLLDPSGAEVTSAATTANPEVLSYWVSQPGIYTYKLVGYATVLAYYTLTSTQLQVVVAPGTQKANDTPPVLQTISEKPREFSLQQNYPNPFNPSTTIAFAIPQDAHVTLEVFNLLGERVAKLLDEQKPAGYYSTTFNAQGIASGLYIYRLVAGDFTQSRKLSLVR